MIACPVCNTMNHHLASVCSSCGGYVQRKVDNLNLFETMWKVIESPKKAFYSIALSRYKNYTLFLAAVAGIGITFTAFWYLKVGEVISELINLLFAGIGLGPIVGILWVTIFCLMANVVMRMNKHSISYRNIFAVSAYALVPIILSVIFILPIEILTYGVFMFTRTPTPYSLKPFSFITIVTIDALCGLWTIILFVIGMKVLSDASWTKTIVLSLLALTLFLALNAGVLMFISSQLVYHI